MADCAMTDASAYGEQFLRACTSAVSAKCFLDPVKNYNDQQLLNKKREDTFYALSIEIGRVSNALKNFCKLVLNLEEVGKPIPDKNIEITIAAVLALRENIKNLMTKKLKDNNLKDENLKDDKLTRLRTLLFQILNEPRIEIVSERPMYTEEPSEEEEDTEEGSKEEEEEDFEDDETFSLDCKPGEEEDIEKLGLKELKKQLKKVEIEEMFLKTLVLFLGVQSPDASAEAGTSVPEKIVKENSEDENLIGMWTQKLLVKERLKEELAKKDFGRLIKEKLEIEEMWGGWINEGFERLKRAADQVLKVLPS